MTNTFTVCNAMSLIQKKVCEYCSELKQTVKIQGLMLQKVLQFSQTHILR